MKNCVFTIVAKNYIGLAQILEQSFKDKNPNIDFFIFVADELDDSVSKEIMGGNVIVAKDHINISNQLWIDMSFKYDLTEFCTAIKPFSFQYLIEELNYQTIIYLDPDIYIYSSFEPIYKMLDNHAVILTPHITRLADKYLGELPENSFMATGIFNLGFCAVRSGEVTAKVLSWWSNRLVDKCYNDSYSNYYTDQKWMDFLPGFVNSQELLITRHLGLNIAPWNFYERMIYLENNILMVSQRDNDGVDQEPFPVIFAHFSGYDYKEMKKGNTIQNNITTLSSYPDIKLLTDVYSKAIYDKSDLFDRYIKEKYTYGYFVDGTEVKIFHRRIYRSLTSKGEKIEQPFGINNSFYTSLKKLGMLKTNESINIDKVTVKNLGSIDSKLAIFNTLARFCYKLIGFEKYLLLIRLMRPFSRYESQIHLFNKNYDKENIKF